MLGFRVNVHICGLDMMLTVSPRVDNVRYGDRMNGYGSKECLGFIT